MAHISYLNTKRVEALVDGVFAIAITLLAFDLKVSDIIASANFSMLDLFFNL